MTAPFDKVQFGCIATDETGNNKVVEVVAEVVPEPAPVAIVATAPAPAPRTTLSPKATWPFPTGSKP